jgi:predicted phage baseplate assembly protein
MSCENDCRPVPAFPKRIDNRPGLATIDYRIGSYFELRAHMLSLLDASPALAEWTHRLPDDPGIALIEAAAEVGDILSFYQDLYANEAYLRSAKWRTSVADLVRLLGYRLAPGLGGRGRFALGVKGAGPVLLPAGLGIKAQLEGDDKPAVFETSAELLAQPALSQFRLYRPRMQPEIRYGSDTFTLAPGSNVSLKAGDRIMVAVARDDGDGSSFDHMQVLVVDSLSQAFGDTILKIKGSITTLKQPVQYRKFAPSMMAAVEPPMLGLINTIAPLYTVVQVSTVLLDAGLAVAALASTPRLQAWKLGASHRHFGHNSPSRQVLIDDKGRASMHDVSYQRLLNATTSAPANPALAARQMPLDGEAGGVLAGTRVLIEANLSQSGAGAGRKRLLERRVAQVDRQSLAWGPSSGASTVLSLDDTIALSESGVQLTHADIRGISFHEVTGEPFALHGEFVPTAAASGHQLAYYGTGAEAAALAMRRLLFAGPGAGVVGATALAADIGVADPGQPGLHMVQLDHEFDYAQFGYDDARVQVYGNVLDASQGKSEAQVVLGDGDARADFQTFALPKTPLTYLLDTTQAPPQWPQVRLWVDGAQWRQVDSLFGRGPNERVYIVRDDADGKSRVQFGDGKTGARLRSGRGNVVARYRTGSGAHGPLKAGASAQADKAVAGLDKAFLLEPVTGGAKPESADGARAAAPGTMQSLGRIVSVADYEAEALAIPGVQKARAAWVGVDGAMLVRVTVLTDSAAPADAGATADALRAAVRARGAGRCPLVVLQGSRAEVSLGLVVGCDPALHPAAVRAAILLALGARGEEGMGVDSSQGLFSWQRRQFGETVHGSQVISAVQNVAGVVWVRLLALDHANAPVPALLTHTPAIGRTLTCGGDQLLALQASALQLQVAADTQGVSS